MPPPVPSRRPSGRRPWVLAAGLLIAALGWLGVRAWQIHADLTGARDELLGVSELTSHAGLSRSGRLAAVAHRALAEADAARAAAQDPLWRLVAAVPVAGRSFALARDLTQVSDRFLHGVLPPLQRAQALVQDPGLVADGRVDLTRLAGVQVPVDQAIAVSRDARERALGLSTRFVPGFLGRQPAALVGGVDRVLAGLSSAHNALALAPPMLGRDGPRRYFVAVLNQAESRAAGGFVGAYAILRAENGRIVKEQAGTDEDFRNAPRPVVDLGPEFSRNYDGYHARTTWSALGVSPHWPYTARIVAGLVAAQGGGRIDGVIGVDPQALGALLAVTGPATVAGRTLDAGNVAGFVLRDEYYQYAQDNTLRKKVLAGLAGAVFNRVLGHTARPAVLLQALMKTTTGGHLQLWSARPGEEALLHHTAIAGELPERAGAFLSVITQNASGNKMDAYLQRRIDYLRPHPGIGRVVLTITNHVPPNAPSVVLGRYDHPLGPVPYGQTELLVTIYGSVHGLIRDMTVNGRPAPFVAGTENDHPTATLLVLVAPGRPTAVAADLNDPGGDLTYRAQPWYLPDQLVLHDPVHLAH